MLVCTQEPSETRDVPSSGVTGYCELSDMGAANQTCPLQEHHVLLTTESWHQSLWSLLSTSKLSVPQQMQAEGILQFSSGLTLSTWRQCQILGEQLSPQILYSPGCDLCSGPTSSLPVRLPTLSCIPCFSGVVPRTQGSTYTYHLIGTVSLLWRTQLKR